EIVEVSFREQHLPNIQQGVDSCVAQGAKRILLVPYFLYLVAHVLEDRPEEIEAESFRIIEEELGPHQWSAREWPIVRRAIHTSADFDYARTMTISPNAVASGIAALKAGCGIVTDTTMIISGMGKERLVPFGVKVSCYVGDAQVAKDAKAQLITRSIVAMRRGARDAGNGIFVIG